MAKDNPAEVITKLLQENAALRKKYGTATALLGDCVDALWAPADFSSSPNHCEPWTVDQLKELVLKCISFRQES